MAKRWNVHHGNENLGLKTAKEIREALRKGTLDPFDKVSAEGSNIREDLIEVDEIFRENLDEEDEEQTQVYGFQAKAAGGAAPAGTVPAPTKAAPYRAPVAEPSRLNAIPFTPAPPPAQWRTEPVQDSDISKSAQKRYYLIDKSKILGPLSALEIQSLFNRGLLNQKVKVQRIGSTRSIPVAQFIESYSEDRLKELNDDGKLDQKGSSPSSKVLNELARVANAQKIAKTRKNKTYIILAAAGLLLGALIFVILDSSRAPRRSESSEETFNRNENRRRNSRPKLVQQSQQPEEFQETEITPAPRKKAVPPPPRAPSPRTEKPKSKSKRVAPQPPIVAPTPAPTPVPIPAPVPFKPKPVVIASIPKPLPKPPAPAPAPVVIPKKEKESPIAKALASSGRIQTIGPLSFSSSALEACDSKCTLTFRDAAGGTIKGIFFKTAYYDQLKKSSSGVFLTGNTRKEGGEFAIFIQDIR